MVDVCFLCLYIIEAIKVRNQFLGNLPDTLHQTGSIYWLTAQFHSMGVYFTGTGTGKLVPANRPRENPSMRVISNMEGYLWGQFVGTICGDVLLVYYCIIY